MSMSVISWNGATRAQRNLSPVVKNLNSTQLFRNLHADYSVPLETRNKYGEIFHAFSVCISMSVIIISDVTIKAIWLLD